jgi:membrane-bound lytic murein transglycosylase MltF
MSNTVTIRFIVLGLLLSLVGGCGDDPQDSAPGVTGDVAVPGLLSESGVLESYSGDLDEIRSRRVLRVLVAPSRSNYFISQGDVRGFEVELMRKFERHLNRNSRSPIEEIHVVFIPRLFSDLISALENGEGDVAAAGITVTPEREKKVAFTEPYLHQVRELIVIHEDVDDIDTIDDIAGRKVLVRAGTSYITHLEELNSSFSDRGLSEIKIEIAEPRITTEEILELVNAGIVDITVADEHIARLWAGVLPEIRVLDDVAVAEGGDIAWAVPHESTGLKKQLSEFVGEIRKGSLTGNVIFNRYYKDTFWVSNPIEKNARKKFDVVADVVKRYASEYDFNWLKVMALAYQESGLDQSKRSPRGAVGVMQILPSTARDTVGIEDIEDLESNIHAGVRYLDHLRQNYFSQSPSDPVAKTDFVFASYNAGPTRISQLRRDAAERGFDPDKWFFNVEHIAAEQIGRETVNYVANVNKYYFAYSNDPEINSQ